MSANLICAHCQGEMQPYNGPKHNRKLGAAIMAGGVFSTLLWTGPLLGLPIVIAGAYMAGKKRKLWVCGSCNTAVERLELKIMPNTKIVNKPKNNAWSAFRSKPKVVDAEVVQNNKE
ncbi:MAG: hypothetical protein ACI9Y8_000213 [Candidatus Omnitrophota bacterium]|jgi:hypothetical protein